MERTALYSSLAVPVPVPFFSTHTHQRSHCTAQGSSSPVCRTARERRVHPERHFPRLWRFVLLVGDWSQHGRTSPHTFVHSVPLSPWHRLVRTYRAARPRSTWSITSWPASGPAMHKTEAFPHSWPKCSRPRPSLTRPPSGPSL